MTAVLGGPRPVVVDRSGCPGTRHGDESAYTRARCRCADAREDRRIKLKRRREGRHVPPFIDATGTVRRLRAAAVMGYGLNALGAYLGVDQSRVHVLRDPQVRGRWRVSRETAQRVKDLLAHLVTLPPPQGPSARDARCNAARRGWYGLGAWDDIDDPACMPDDGRHAKSTGPDPVVVDRLIAAPEGVTWGKIPRPERIELVHRLHDERGWAMTAIGDTYGAHPTAVRHFYNRHVLGKAA